MEPSGGTVEQSPRVEPLIGTIVWIRRAEWEDKQCIYIYFMRLVAMLFVDVDVFTVYVLADN